MQEKNGKSTYEVERELIALLTVAELVASTLSALKEGSTGKHKPGNVQYGSGAHPPTRDQER